MMWSSLSIWFDGLQQMVFSLPLFLMSSVFTFISLLSKMFFFPCHSQWATYKSSHCSKHVFQIQFWFCSQFRFVWCSSTVGPLQVVLVFPGPEAVSVKDIRRCLGNRSKTKLHDHFDEPCPKRLAIEDPNGGTQGAKNPEAEAIDEAKIQESKVFPLQRVVFIDSTWNQTNKIITDERLQGNHERLK